MWVFFNGNCTISQFIGRKNYFLTSYEQSKYIAYSVFECMHNQFGWTKKSEMVKAE